MLRDEIIQAINDVGFDEYCEINSDELIFSEDVFDSCSRCENYGKNYSCPPLSGNLEENKARFTKYEHAIIVNKVIYLGQYYELMQSSGEEFGKLIDELRKLLEGKPVMIAGPGGCRLCEKCACLTDEPCRFPDKRRYSLEGSGMDVVTMSRNNNMTYNGGDHKVGYFMMVMY